MLPLTAKYKRKLQDEGFKHVYAWTDKPYTTYPRHKHRGRVSFYVTTGSITVHVGRKRRYLKRGQRMNVSVGVYHTGRVGPRGASFMVGEEIKGDSE